MHKDLRVINIRACTGWAHTPEELRYYKRIQGGTLLSLINSDTSKCLGLINFDMRTRLQIILIGIFNLETCE